MTVFIDCDFIKEVHRRRADKGGDKAVLRCLVDVIDRVIHLRDAVFQYDDTFSQSQSIILVMGDIDDGRMKDFVDAA